MASTVAEIPAETKTAQQTEYLSAVPLTAIRPHPKNIRHNAIADDELVASIKDQGLLQPLVVIPGDDEGIWILIAGHRRLDGLERAGFTFAPVVVRYDLTTEADQIAAMLVENGRRADLSPIEEAEGFDALLGLDWTVERVSEATGRSTGLIKQRRKLMTLTPKAREHVGTGQVTIDDALRLAKLPAAEQKKLEKRLGVAGFGYEIATAEHRVEKNKAIDQRVRELKDAGGKELKKPNVSGTWQLSHASHGMVPINRMTTSPTIFSHDGCLGYVRAGDETYPELWEVCTDPLKHDTDLTQEQLARKAERDEEAAKRAERAAKRDEEERAYMIARDLRVQDLVAAIKVKPSQLDPTLQALMVARLQSELTDGHIGDEPVFRQTAGIPDPPDAAATNEHEAFETVSLLTGIKVVKAFATLAALEVEDTLRLATRQWHEITPGDQGLCDGYFRALSAAGHEINAVDQQLIDTISGEEAAE